MSSRIAALSAASPADVLPFVAGQVLHVDFSRNGNSEAYCLSGWAEAEPDERWMLGTQSRLRLSVPDAACTLVFQLRPFVVRERLPSQRLTVLVKGEALAHFTLRDRTTRAVAVPRRLIGPAGTLDVTLLAPDAARPVDLEVSRDDRRLSVALSRLTVQADPHAPTEVTEDEEASIDIEAIAEADRMSQAELMLQFESLGQNCEFGLVQRSCGAEPLGLLRFSSTPLPKLLNALEAGFVGMGLPNSMEIVPSRDGQEYMVHDTAFGFRYHAWVRADEQRPGEVLRRELRRVPFLVRKLVSDLESAEKIFVFRGMGALPEEEVFPLAVSLRRYGPNTLLFVNLADAEHRAGTVVQRAPGFLVGYIDRFAPGSNAHDFEAGRWVRLCREACRVRLAARAAAGPGTGSFEG